VGGREPLRVGVREGGADAAPIELHVLHRLCVEEELDHVILDPLPHFLEEVEGLALVLHQRVSLAIGSESDALTQVVQRQQVVLPLAVDGVEEKELLEPGELLLTELLSPCFVVRGGAVGEQSLELRPVDRFPVDAEIGHGQTEVR